MTAEDEPESPDEAPVPRKNDKRLLRVVAGEMSRKEIRDALKLKSGSDVKRRFLDPCLDKGWIEITMPENERSPKQRFRITPVGQTWVEAFEDE